MKKRRILSIVLITLLVIPLTSCSKKEKSSEKKSKDITIACDYSVKPLVDDLVKDFNLNNKTSYKIEYLSATEGITRLKDKEVNLVVAFEGIKDDKLKTEVIGSDGIAIVVNKNNNIDGISMDQLKDIYTGKKTLWKDFNSNMDTVKPVAYESTSDLEKLFEKKILSTPVTEQMSSVVVIVRDVNVARDTVVNSSNDIAFMPSISVTDNLKMLKLNGVILNVESIKNNLYPFKSNICAYHGKESEDTTKFTQYLKSDDGKKIIKKHCADAS